jgi:hypothetical protein
MAREVDIWWESGGRLKASMRWTNKRGRISFTLIPSSGGSSCEKCPFKGNPICSKWRKENRAYRHLCSMLWSMKGDNRFEKRHEIIGWQPLGPLGREKKKKDKF